MSDSALTAVVVDDEPLAREGLASALHELGVNVVALCCDGHAARSAIRTLKPSLLLLDVEMPELDGFATLDAIEPEEMPPVVIIVTAYDQYALRAFQAFAFDYVLKPVSSERLRDVIARATRRLQEIEALEQISAHRDEGADTTKFLSQLAIRDRDVLHVIPVSSIEWIQAESYYVRVHAAHQKPRLLRERMSILESRLDPATFVRTHRSAIVRLDLVRSIRTLTRYESIAVLSSGGEVPVSRERRGRLEEMLRTR